MFTRSKVLALVMVLLSLSMAGCFGQSKATGKFSNQDKPKPVEPQK